MPYVSGGRIEGPIFNEEPQEGDAFYLGHGGNLAGHSLQLTLDCGGEAATHIDPKAPPLVWEYWSDDRGDWAPLLLLDDSGTGRRRDPAEVDPTYGFTRPGDVFLHVPSDSRPVDVDGVEATWIRVRYVRREGQAYSSSPTIAALRSQTIAATTRARHSFAIEREVIGQGDGEPNQRFQLRESPVLTAVEPHTVEAPRADETVQWTEVPDFSTSSDSDTHFTVDYAGGEIHFGPFIRARDGGGRQYGAAPRSGDTLILHSYRSGGGTVGNVGEGAIAQLRSSVPYVAAVVNYRPASGGLNLESLDEAKLRALSVMRTTETAVTKEDYERLAMAVSGVGRAHCVLDVSPGTVRVVLVPQLGEPDRALQPEDLAPSRTLVRDVSLELDERKIVGTLIQYEGAPTRAVDIDVHLYVCLAGVDTDVLAAEAEAAMRRFTHPIHGGRLGAGTDLGSAVTESQMAGLLQGVPGVSYVERVRMRVDGDETARAEAPADGLLILGQCYVLAEAVE